MSESPREQLLVAVQAALESMTGPRYWGDSYPTAPTVERLYKEPSRVNQLPHLCLLQDSAGLAVSAFSRRYADSFRFALYGYVDGNDLTTPSTWVERLNRDCKLTLVAAAAPGGSLAALLRQLDFGDEVFQFDEHHGEFLLLVEAIIDDSL
jgi:hypothetical protein